MGGYKFGPVAGTISVTEDVKRISWEELRAITEALRKIPKRQGVLGREYNKLVDVGEAIVHTRIPIEEGSSAVP